MCGWNVSFEELRRIAEYQMVHGVTLLCQHLAPYSLGGIRKRDAPAALFVQQPWWKEYRHFNDFISRVGMLLTLGNVHFSVLDYITLSAIVEISDFPPDSYFVDIRHRAQKCSMIQVVHRWIIPIE